MKETVLENDRDPVARPAMRVPKGSLIYLLRGNVAFVRLLSTLIETVPGFNVEVVTVDSLDEALERRWPQLLIVIEDEQQYRLLRANGRLATLPILYVTVSEYDSAMQPALMGQDRSWIMKNDPAELLALLREAAAPPKPKTILCVDDSITVLNQLRKAFAGTPYALSCAGNGREALNLLESMRPDLILTDVEMPVMDGLTFCRSVRSRPETADLPMIILSSRMDYETVSNGFESGADEYLTKPFTPDELLNKVESYLVPAPTRRKEQILLLTAVPNLTHQLRLALTKQGFGVWPRSSPAEALQLAMSEVPDLIIADAELPGMTGFEFCSQVRAESRLRHVPFVLMCSRTTAGARKMGKKVGVSGYLTKPFTREGLLALVERHLAEHRSLKALEWDMVLASITSLAKALDERDPYTRFHSENVARYALAIGRKAGLNSRELENLRLAGQLHDIGKIGIPDKVLHKPGRLTSEEFELIKAHSTLGAEILRPISRLESVIPAILHHHERIDGTGYPAGLRGNQIPVAAQIMAVADTFDALVTDRPYRKGMSRSEAERIMREVSGTQLASRYVELFLEWLDSTQDGEPDEASPGPDTD